MYDLPFDFRLMSAYECRDRPHEVFANDLIYILCCYTRLYHSPVNDAYIHPHSPVTRDVHYGAYRISEQLREHRSHYRWQLEFVKQILSKDELYNSFLTKVDKLLHTIFRAEATEIEVLALVTRAILMAVDYYEYGCHNAIRLVHNCILAALETCNRMQNYHLFYKIAQATRDYDFS